MQQACLAVTVDGLDLDAIRDRVRRGVPAETAEEFLIRVRMEADELPDVVEATHIDARVYDCRQTRYMPSQPELPACLPDRLPTEQWERDVAMAFLNMRQTLSCLDQRYQFNRQRVVKVPPLRCERKWWRFFYGDRPMTEGSEQHGEEGEEEEQEQQGIEAMQSTASIVAADPADREGPAPPGPDAAAAPPPEVFGGPHEPRVSLVLQFDNVMTVKLLRFHAKWLEATSQLDPESAGWIFALLARLETPLIPDTAAIVRQLYRRCYILRSSLAIPSTTREGEKGDDMQHDGLDTLPLLNTVIAITGHFFRQGEATSLSCFSVSADVVHESSTQVVQQWSHGRGGGSTAISMDPSDWDMEEEDDDEDGEAEEEGEEEQGEKEEEDEGGDGMVEAEEEEGGKLDEQEREEGEISE